MHFDELARPSNPSLVVGILQLQQLLEFAICPEGDDEAPFYEIFGSRRRRCR